MAASGSISSCSGMKRQHASNLLPADPQTTANPFGCLKTRCFASCLQAKPAHAGKFDPGSPGQCTAHLEAVHQAGPQDSAAHDHLQPLDPPGPPDATLPTQFLQIIVYAENTVCP